MKVQPKAAGSLPLAVHSYAHLSKRLGVHPYFKLRQPLPAATQRAPRAKSWNVPALCAAYNWPNGLPGGGVIAIVELGGGWTQSDMDTFFGGIGQPAPMVTDVSVDTTRNTPNTGPNSADGEVALDIQVAAAAYFAATGHQATIRVYWSQDIAAAVRAATADGCDVCSISWGSDEANWRAQSSRAGLDMELAATKRPTRVWSCLLRPVTMIPAMADRRARTSIFRLPARISSAAVERPRRTQQKPFGTTIPVRRVERERVAAFPRCFLCRLGRLEHRMARAEWCRTWPQMPTRIPDTKFSCTALRWLSVGRVRLRRFTPGFSRPSGPSSVLSHPSCG